MEQVKKKRSKLGLSLRIVIGAAAVFALTGIILNSLFFVITSRAAYDLLKTLGAVAVLLLTVTIGFIIVLGFLIEKRQAGKQDTTKFPLIMMHLLVVLVVQLALINPILQVNYVMHVTECTGPCICWDPPEIARTIASGAQVLAFCYYALITVFTILILRVKLSKPKLPPGENFDADTVVGENGLDGAK